jgi:hypothetical protein
MWPVRGGRSIVLPPPWHTAAPAFLRSTIAFMWVAKALPRIT